MSDNVAQPRQPGQLIRSVGERMFVDYIHSAKDKIGATIPSTFDIATSQPTTGRFTWRPNAYEGRGNLTRRLSGRDWIDQNCSARDTIKDEGVYVVMLDGSGLEGWVSWDDVPINIKRSSAATKQRLAKKWCAENGLLSGGQVSAAAGPSNTSATTTTSATAGVLPVTPANNGNRPGMLLRSRTLGHGSAMGTVPTEPSYDGLCNEPSPVGAKHQGKSRVCTGAFVPYFTMEFVPHGHSTGEGSSTECHDETCASGKIANFKVCEGCEEAVWDNEYSADEKKYGSLALQVKRPIDSTAMCQTHADKVRVLLEQGSIEVHTCYCSYWTGKQDTIKPAKIRTDELREPVNKKYGGVWYDEAERFLADVFITCAHHGCSKSVVLETDFFRCNHCFGYVDNRITEDENAVSADDFASMAGTEGTFSGYYLGGQSDPFHSFNSGSAFPDNGMNSEPQDEESFQHAGGSHYSFADNTAGDDFTHGDLFGADAPDIFDSNNETLLDTVITEEQFLNSSAAVQGIPPVIPDAGAGAIDAEGNVDMMDVDG